MAAKQYYRIITFYRFKEIKNKNLLKYKLEEFLKNFLIKGTILLSNEGINGSLSGTNNDLKKIIHFLKQILNIRQLNIKTNDIDFLPFNRLKVRIKKEIVSLGKGNINVIKLGGKKISPEIWDKLISKKKVKILDVRNIYEIEIGKFKNALNPETNNFRQFPNSVKRLNIRKNDEIAMYCTGGIRCEKASAYLRSKGFKKIYQLEGGIINYLDYKKNDINNSLWTGECFVFDERVTVNKKLKKGRYHQCYGCRRAITVKDTLSVHYKKGIHCPYCFTERTKKQIKRSTTRQNQIDNAISKNINNIYVKIKI